MPQLERIGWREWVSLPELGVPKLKVKVDTGARTSAIHTHGLKTFTKDGKTWVRFKLLPSRGEDSRDFQCEAPVIDERKVRDSGGHQERRYVIRSLVELGSHRWPVEITLTRRDNMRFRMLLGRTAMNGRFVVDPAASYLLGKR